MRKKYWLGFVLLFSMLLTGCSHIAGKVADSAKKTAVQTTENLYVGEGEFELLTQTIRPTDNELRVKSEGIDEEKITYIYVANEKVFEQKMKNGEEYTISIAGVKDAHRLDYKPKVQLIQFEDDNEDGEMTTFRQERYTVEK
ncbi:hypothetical protein [Vagococcus acidifermentans]|uniref:Lipoprotein n=1 Tax=Vagococcus acidifermentans TaxID=564710 RepID=A0A430AVR9_9ENTE|nr:hypothetical protein [Vagococcus acidifermentans]RSU12141.1 hypothetical protein CBF27_06875 [Vagococcus acidifermentans]